MCIIHPSNTNIRSIERIGPIVQAYNQLYDKVQQIVQKDQQLMQTYKTLNKVLPHFSPPTKNPDKNNTFVILDKKSGEKYQYYAIRIQKGSLQNRLDELKINYPNYEIIRLDNEPNAVKLYNLMKEDMVKDELIDFGGNHFNTPLIRSILLRNIKMLYQSMFVEK